MTGSRNPRVGLTLSTTQLDVLELVRQGALPAYPLDAPQGTVVIPLTSSLERLGTAEEVEVTDLEGVAVARVPVMRAADGVFACGRPVWLSPRSSRPYEEHHIAPAAALDRTGVVLLRTGTVERDDLSSALCRAGARPLLLVLASLDGDVGPDVLETVRQARRMLGLHPGARLAVAPVPSSLTPEEVDTVVRSFARDSPVVEPAPAPYRRRQESVGTVLFFTGLSGSGKSTLARAVRNQLLERGVRVTLLDGDLVRRHLSAGLGFSVQDRDTNIRRIGWVAAQVAHHGGTAICSPIAPVEATRQEVRRMVESAGGRFVLVHVSTPLEECERRDRKGLYARARRGEIPDFTGISSPYEVPAAPDLRLDTTGRDVDALADEVLRLVDTGARC